MYRPTLVQLASGPLGCDAL